MSGALALFLCPAECLPQTILRLSPHDTGGYAYQGKLSGNGDLIAFLSNADLTGQNPRRAVEIFTVRPDGSGLAQRTLTPRGANFRLSLSDDGNWIAFLSDADLLGANADGTPEIYAIRSDGTGLVQVTKTENGASFDLMISGDGSWIAFASTADFSGENPEQNAEIFVIRRDGTGLRQLTTTYEGAGYAPRISADGQWVVFASTADPLGRNPDGRSEIFSVRSDGSGLTQLTDSIEGENFGPFLAGNGLKVAYATRIRPDLPSQIAIVDRAGGIARLLTSFAEGDSYNPVTDFQGTVVSFISNSTYGNRNPEGNLEVFISRGDGSGLAMVTKTATGNNLEPQLDRGGTRVVFSSDSIYQPLNLDASLEIFTTALEGGEFRSVSAIVDSASTSPRISADGSRIAFCSNADFLKMNEDRSRELWAVKPDGASLRQLTDGIGGSSFAPSISEDGEWIVFLTTADLVGRNGDGNVEVCVVRSDRSSLRQLTVTVSGNAQHVAISGDGTRVVFTSTSNLTGENEDRNPELFLIDRDGSGLRQLTDTLSGENSFPTIDRSGNRIVFVSTVRPANLATDDEYRLYQISSDGTELRLLTPAPFEELKDPFLTPDGALLAFAARQSGAGGFRIFLLNVDTRNVSALACSGSNDCLQPRIFGQNVFFASNADLTGNNRSLNFEIFVTDLAGREIHQWSDFLQDDTTDPWATADGSQLVFSSAAPINAENLDRSPEVFYSPHAEKPSKYRKLIPRFTDRQDTFTGVSFSNLTGRPLTARFAARSSDGGLLAYGDNPALRTLESNQHFAHLTGEVFGSSATAEGHIDVQLSDATAQGFFMIGSTDLRRMDGVSAHGDLSGDLIFTSLDTSLRQTIHLHNPHFETVLYELEIWDNTGTRVAERSGQIFPRGSAMVEVNEFRGLLVEDRGYARVQATQGLRGILVDGTEGRLKVLDGLPASPTAGHRLLVPHVAELTGYVTFLHLVNWGDEALVLNLSLYTETAQVLARREIALGPRTQLSTSARELFGLDILTGSYTGWILIETSRNTVIGTAHFEDPGGKYGAALTVQSQGARRYVFPHFANGFGYFTGISVVNPGSDSASVTLRVFDRKGVERGSATFDLRSSEKRARLLQEWVSEAKNLDAGYVLIESSLPVNSFELFWSDGLTLLSSVPGEPFE